MLFFMNMKKINMNLDENPFTDFFTSRLSISFRVNAQKTYDYAKKNNLSFFILSLGCLLHGLNSVSEFKRRIIDDEVVEFEKIDAITPILNKDYIIREMRVQLPQKGETLKKWHDKIIDQEKTILNNDKPALSDVHERDSLPVANFSCIPWIGFDSLTAPIEKPNQIQPLITWGKLNKDGEVPVAISASHIFIYGYHIKLFQDNIQDNFNNPEKIVE